MQTCSEEVSFRYQYTCEECGALVEGVQKKLLSEDKYKSAGNLQGLELTESEKDTMNFGAHIQASAYQKKLKKKIAKGDYTFFDGGKCECPYCKKIQSWSVSLKQAAKYFLYMLLIMVAAAGLEWLCFSDGNIVTMDWIMGIGTGLIGSFSAVLFCMLGIDQWRAVCQNKRKDGSFPSITFLNN
jgi:hypothetical protein